MRSILLILGVNLIYIYSFGQVSTNGGSGLNATYSSLADAITDLNTATISSPVVITLGAGQTAPASGYVITASGSATNTITINGAGFTVTAGIQPAGGAYDAIFKLLGADWVTIQNFKLQENASNTVLFPAASNTMTEWGIALFYASTTNGAENCTITGNTITMNADYRSWGIYSNSSHSPTDGATIASATGPNGGNNNLKIYGNTTKNTMYGIAVVGPTAAEDHLTGLDIGGNTSATGNIIEFSFNTWNSSGVEYANAQLFPADTHLGGGSPAYVYYGVLVRNSNGTNISYNSFSSPQNSFNGVTSALYMPKSSNSPTGTHTTKINSNTFSLYFGTTGGQPVAGIDVWSGAASGSSTLEISGNQFTRLEFSGSGNGPVYGISDRCSALKTIINNNTFTNINTGGLAITQTTVLTTSLYCIHTQFSMPAGGSKEFIDNMADGLTVIQRGSVVAFIYDNSTASNANSTTTVRNNTCTNVFTPAVFNNPAQVRMLYCLDEGVVSITENTFSNLSGAAGLLPVMFAGNGNAGTLISDNTITNVSGAGAIIGIIGGYGSGTNGDVIRNNIISKLTSSGNGQFVIGIRNLGTSNRLIEKNTIYDLETTAGVSGTAGYVYGIETIDGGNVTIQNNVIGDLRGTSNLDNSISGIAIKNSTAITANIYNNTVFLNATGLGTNFGSSALEVSTVNTVNLKNNILINLSTANGTGKTVAYRRSSTTLTTYGSGSDRNLFYAGTPSSSKLIFFDGTNSDQTLTAFKTRVASRDANSITASPTFLSTDGNDPGFLRIDPTDNSGVIAGAGVIATVTDDIDGEERSQTPTIGADELGTEPDAPTNLVATLCGNQVDISFTAGANGGSPITNYEYSLDGMSWVAFNPAVTGTTVTVTDLTDGLTYTFQLRAVNAVGTSVSSTTVTATIDNTVTIAYTGPTIVTATNKSASITLSAAVTLPVGANVAQSALRFINRNTGQPISGWETITAGATPNTGTVSYAHTLTLGTYEIFRKYNIGIELGGPNSCFSRNNAADNVTVTLAEPSCGCY